MNKIPKFFLLLTIAFSLFLNVIAQTDIKEPLPNGWYLKDQKETGIFGISLDKAYQFVKNKKSKLVIVAVIDGGVDTLHEDLKEILWHNPKEIPGNGIDDDKNGYVDDIYGWNFLGGKDGRNVTVESLERDRVYHQYKSRYEGKSINPDSLSKDELPLYEMWKKAKDELFKDDGEGGLDLALMKMAYQNMTKTDSILQKALGKTVYTGKELEKFTPAEDRLKRAKEALLEMMEATGGLETSNKEFNEGFRDYLDQEQRKADAKEKAPKNFRDEIVKDNYNDISDRYYGNNNVFVDDKAAFHGTHVTGIIGAKRNNKIGIDGIADNVKIMMIRAVPDGDEHDKDIALAIRYAVDNGAQVINMSFGKYFSPEKKWVDEAIQYAQSKSVLLVSAAGNEAFNADSIIHFPEKKLNNGKIVTNWISVGASGDLSIDQYMSDGTIYHSLPAYFSNYGKDDVDVFAPGMKIYSTITGGNAYGNAQGTSMASPVVAGMAALILSYYPTLSAEQVKYAIEKSAVAPLYKVNIPGTEKVVNMSDLCKSGGVVNAYEAIKLAATLKGERGTGNNLKPF